LISTINAVSEEIGVLIKANDFCMPFSKSYVEKANQVFLKPSITSKAS